MIGFCKLWVSTMSRDVKGIKLTEQQKRAIETFIPNLDDSDRWRNGGTTTDSKVSEVVKHPEQPMINLEKKDLIIFNCYDKETGYDYELTDLGIEYMRIHNP